MHLGQFTKTVIAAAAAGAMLLPVAACGSNADAGKTKLSFLSWDNEQVMKLSIT